MYHIITPPSHIDFIIMRAWGQTPDLICVAAANNKAHAAVNNPHKQSYTLNST